MAKDHALIMQASKNTYLFVESCNIKYAIYRVGWRVGEEKSPSVGVTS
jgi:hypothetical protein